MISTEIRSICSFFLTIGSLHICFHCWPVTRWTSWYFPFVSLFDKNLFVEWCSSHICNKVTSSPLTHPARLCFIFHYISFPFYIQLCQQSPVHLFYSWKLLKHWKMFCQLIFFHMQRATLLEYFNKCIFSKPLCILWCQCPTCIYYFMRKSIIFGRFQGKPPKTTSNDKLQKFIFDPLKCHWSTCKTSTSFCNMYQIQFCHMFFFNDKYLVSQVSSFATWYF